MQGYTLHVHTASGGKGYTLRVRWRWKGISPSRSTAGGGKGYTLHVYIVNGGKGTPCTSILLAKETDTPRTSILLAVKRDTTCTSILLIAGGERDSHCTCKLQVVESGKVMASSYYMMLKNHK
jgi:hypothetical protein